MQITRKSVISGIVHTREIDITEEQYTAWLNEGGLIQEIMPHLSADDREFVMTGITPKEWKEAFGDEDKDE